MVKAVWIRKLGTNYVQSCWWFSRVFRGLVLVLIQVKFISTSIRANAALVLSMVAAIPMSMSMAPRMVPDGAGC